MADGRCVGAALAVAAAAHCAVCTILNQENGRKTLAPSLVMSTIGRRAAATAAWEESCRTTTSPEHELPRSTNNSLVYSGLRRNKRRGDAMAATCSSTPQEGARSKVCAVCKCDSESYHLNYGASTCFRSVLVEVVQSLKHCL